MTTHHFSPTHYHTAIGSYEPVLRIAPGDSVITTTVDARGFDVNNQQITPRGNPMTGPFFIEGAEPGDTLVVHLDSIVPNRSFGWSGVWSLQRVDPSFVPHLPWDSQADGKRGEWLVDAKAGTATLIKPETSLGRFTLPLNPMLGCFGVAPAGGQAISTATSAEHGGNMDYNGFVSGVTVFSRRHKRSLSGRRSRVQGDGGSQARASKSHVQFTVGLQKGKKIIWPRGENADSIFTVGNARPLDQCVQHATSEMIRWLTSADYGMDATAANTLLGQCVEYNLGNIFDPAFTMVCKMKKKWLAK